MQNLVCTHEKSDRTRCPFGSMTPLCYLHATSIKYLGNLTCLYFTRNRGLPAGLSSDYLRSRGDYASTTRGVDLTRLVLTDSYWTALA